MENASCTFFLLFNILSYNSLCVVECFSYLPLVRWQIQHTHELILPPTMKYYPYAIKK